jgi:lysophospholipase L1-like esterase
MKTRTPRLKHALFLALAILIPLSIILCAAELIVRHFDPEIRLRQGLRNPFWAPHPTRHHALKPGHYTNTLWEFPFHVNKLGFRGPEILKEKPPGTIRILCLGDSITMGSGLPDETIYPRVMEGILLDRYPGHGFEVVNMGVSGYEIEEEYLQFKEEGLFLSPDAVVLQFCLNDVPGVEFSDLVNPLRDLALPGKEFLLAHLALARLSRERYNRLGLRNTFLGLAHLFEMAPESPESQRIEKGFREYEGMLREIASLCRDREFRFLLVIVPHRAQFEDRRARYIPQKRLIALSRKAGFDVLDLVPLFSALDSLPYVYPDPVHPHPQGHQIIAQAIIQWLESDQTFLKTRIQNVHVK